MAGCGRGIARPPAHFIGLPGNPVSSFVTFLLFVRPFVLALAGRRRGRRRLRLPLTAGFDWPRPDRRREFLRVRIDPRQPAGWSCSATRDRRC